MIHVTSLFSQLLQHFSRTEFASIVKKHNAEKDAKGFTCWNQFVSMMFCHLAHADSLREICNGLRCCLGKVKHLGINKATNKSTLSYAKVHVLLDHDHYMPSFVRITKAKEHDIKTARTLALNPGSIVAMDRAYNDYILFGPWTAKGIFFVTRLKENAVYEVVEDRPVPKKPEHHLRSDHSSDRHGRRRKTPLPVTHGGRVGRGEPTRNIPLDQPHRIRRHHHRRHLQGQVGDRTLFQSP